MNKVMATVLATALADATFAADSFVNPYADLGVSSAVSNQVKQLTWCSLGTSITDFDDNPIAGRQHGYQYYTMQLLGWDYATKLYNAGHSGTLVSSAASKPPATPYDIYTIEFAVNDWARGHEVGTLDDYKNYLYNGRAVRWDNFAACYRNLVEMIRKVNDKAIIVLITPRKAYGVGGFPPDCEGQTLAEMVDNYYSPEAGTNVKGRQTYLKEYADLIKAIGAYEGFTVVDWFPYAANQQNLKSLSVDEAVHPNDAGYKIMAAMLAPKILEAVATAGTGGGGTVDPPPVDPPPVNPPVTPPDTPDDPPSGDGKLVNIAPLASNLTITTPGTSKWNKNLADISALSNGWGAVMTIGGWNTPGNNWQIFTDSGVDLSVQVDFVWPTVRKVTKIFVATYDGNTAATQLMLKDGKTGEELKPTTHTIDGNDYYKINQGDGHLYTFSTPIALSELRIEATKNKNGRYYGFYEIEVWAEEDSPAAEPHFVITICDIGEVARQNRC